MSPADRLIPAAQENSLDPRLLCVTLLQSAATAEGHARARSRRP